jgi:hypothetical protein
MEKNQEKESTSKHGNQIDIFLSYAREDRAEAEVLANALKSQGWSVWFDVGINAGEKWDKALEAALESARCVVILWSNASINSDWVRAEAESARIRGIALPIRINDVQPPIIFRTIQTPNLLEWGGKVSHPGFLELVKGISQKLEKPEPNVKPVTPKHRLNFIPYKLLIGSSILPILAGLTLNLTHVSEIAINLDATVSQFDLTLDKESDIFDGIIVRELNISGLKEIQIPRAKTLDGHHRDAYIVQSDNITLTSPTIPKENKGSITVDPISAQSGTRLQFLKHNATSLELSGIRDPIRVNLKGNVTLHYPPDTNYISDFGSPKPLLCVGDGRDISTVITPVEAPSQWLSSALPINHLTFSRIEEKTTLTKTSIARVSTIISGTLKIESLEDKVITLTPRQLIRFGKIKGEITALSLANEGIRLQFVGTTSALESCVNATCQNLIPSRWKSLIIDHALIAFNMLALYASSTLALWFFFWR